MLLDGITLTHEHMSINLSPGDLDTDSFDELVSDLKTIYRCGVRNIIDLTNQSMGRDVQYTSRLMKETGINIVSSTGYYIEPYVKPYVSDRSVEELTNIYIRDLTEGIDGTDIKAGVIGEIGWSADGPDEYELKAWEAAAIAAVKTSCVVSVHPSRGRQMIKQTEFLISRGVLSEKIIIGHIEFFPTEEVLLNILKTGVNIGLDMVGKTSIQRDDYRAGVFKLVRDSGYLPNILLSTDICRRQDLKSFGSYGYVHLFETFIPKLKKLGITDDEINTVLIDNPKRIFK